jgi:hypothetical protein
MLRSNMISTSLNASTYDWDLTDRHALQGCCGSRMVPVSPRRSSILLARYLQRSTSVA